MKTKDRIYNHLMNKVQDIRLELLKKKFGDLEFDTFYNILTENTVTCWKKDLPAETNKKIQEYISDFDNIFFKITVEIKEGK